MEKLRPVGYAQCPPHHFKRALGHYMSPARIKPGRAEVAKKKKKKATGKKATGLRNLSKHTNLLFCSLGFTSVPEIRLTLFCIHSA